MDKPGLDMTIPQYPIGEVAALTGLHPQTVRYYEKCGILTPYKDKSGQRLYSYFDVLNIMQRSQYKALGLSVEETERLFTGTLEKSLSSLLEEKLREKERELLDLQIAADHLRQLSRQLERIPLCAGRILWMERPAQWHLPYSRDGVLCFNGGGQTDRRLLSNSAFSFSFPASRDGNWQENADWDLAMEPEPAAATGFPTGKDSFFVPARMCLYTIFTLSGKKFLRREALRPLYAYMEENALENDGDIYGCQIVFQPEKQGMVRYYEVWMPVRERKGLQQV